MSVTKAYAVLLVLCGVTTLAMPLVIGNYWILAATVSLFGLFFASNFSFTPPILVELIPLERFTTAYGLILLCQGIGNLLGPPLGGMYSFLTLTVTEKRKYHNYKHKQKKYKKCKFQHNKIINIGKNTKRKAFT